MNVYPWLRKALFVLDPEAAHALTLNSLKCLAQWGLLKPLHLAAPCTVMGINFPNRIGLAAGLDKNGEYINALNALGFGFLEIGTITPLAQPGNPKPRLFRLPQAQALINRMGFNNKGVDYLLGQVQQSQFRGILGINIGKNAATPLEKAVEDYLFCLRKVYSYASYIAINISSPNTVGLRQLQSAAYLDELIAALKQEQQFLSKNHSKYVPLAVKIAPDMTHAELAVMAQILLKHKIDAIIATNTTVGRDDVTELPHGQENGGLSGKPLFDKATAVIYDLQQLLQNRIPIIAAGGITSAETACAKIVAGASLVQLYTGLIYQGPRLIRQIHQAFMSHFASGNL